MDLLLAMGAYFIQGLSYILFHRYLNLSKPNPTLKPKTKSFSLTGDTTTTLMTETQKELRNHRSRMLVSGGIALGLTFWLSIPALVKVTFLITGVATGFLVGIVRFNHWNQIMAHEYLKQSQPPKPKNQMIGLGLLALWLVGTWIPIQVRSMVGGDVAWLGIVALGLMVSASYSGYYLEHLLLYNLNKDDFQLPPADDQV